ncbi:MAG: hypothetical protein KKE43_02975, partial [Actinobacteria bacterium]|nr:hypothetical protein [Actinomycetota bacterium]
MRKFISITAAAVIAAAILLPGVAAGTTRLGSYIGSWKQSVGGGFGKGAENTIATSLVEYDGDLYAGVSNENGCQVWVKGAGGWMKVNDQPGFGDAENKGIARMATFGGNLYAGTANEANGCGVWEYDGNNWTQVNADGFDKASNISVTAMEVFGGKLYVGVANFDMGSMKSDGGEIHSYDGLAWTAEMTGGFGDTKNMAVSSLATYGGTLYAGTTRVDIKTELIDFTQIKATLTSVGCEFRKLSGAKWPKVAGDGFTNKRNAAVSAMEVFDGKLFIGTTNGDATATVDIVTQEVSE